MNCFIFQKESSFQIEHPTTNVSLTTKQTTISKTNSYSLNSFSYSVSSPSADSLTIDTAESRVGPVSRVVAAATYEAQNSGDDPSLITQRRPRPFCIPFPISNVETDGHISCDLNLTLAPSTLQANCGPYAARTPVPHQEFDRSRESKCNDNGKGFDMMVSSNHRNGGNGDTRLSSSKEASNNFQAPTAAIARVNDVFWEQFLTERPNNQEPAGEIDVFWEQFLTEGQNNQEPAPAPAGENYVTREQLTVGSNNKGPPAVPSRANDLFWEQFLTERPNNQEPATVNDVLSAVPARLNDLFWEQFLTERPNNQEPATVNDVLSAVPARLNDLFWNSS